MGKVGRGKVRYGKSRFSNFSPGGKNWKGGKTACEGVHLGFFLPLGEIFALVLS